MPFRTGPHTPAGVAPRTKIQFTTGAWMPQMIYRACLITGTSSNTTYAQTAICEKLARDLDVDLDELLSRLPKGRTMSVHLFNPDDPPERQPGGHRTYYKVNEDSGGGVGNIGPANTVEEVPERAGHRF